MHNSHHNKRLNIKTHFLPLFGSLIEKVLNGEQKFSSEEAKGCEKISEREAEGTNPAVTGSVPNKEAEKGTLGATLPAGIGPLAPVVCWKKINLKRMFRPSKKGLKNVICHSISFSQVSAKFL